MLQKNQEVIGSVPLFIRRLMPNASDPEREEAAENFRRYMAVVREIQRRSIKSKD